MNNSTINNQVSSSSNHAQLRVAIVHDWLVGGGAEKVVLELHKMFPDAPIYTSYATDEWRLRLDDKVITGWLQHFGKFRKVFILPRIWWFTHLDLSNFDLIISSSGNGEAFAVRKNYIPLRKRLPRFINYQKSTITYVKPKLHLNYCHSPTHYYWRHYEQYMQNPGFGVLNPVIRAALRLLVAPLRRWDYKAAQRADIMLANSTHIQSDIREYYGRESEVVFPPVNTKPFNDAPPQQRSGYLSLGRQVPQKFVHIIVQACNKLQVPLLVAGNGPEHDNLRKIAGPTISFDGSRFPDEQTVQYMAASEAFIFSSLEDFGITPVEAMAAGTPVIAFKGGGALDYVVPGVTGEFFDEQTDESLQSTLETFNPAKYHSYDIKLAANRFSIDEFHKKIHSVIEKAL